MIFNLLIDVEAYDAESIFSFSGVLRRYAEHAHVTVHHLTLRMSSSSLFMNPFFVRGALGDHHHIT